MVQVEEQEPSRNPVLKCFGVPEGIQEGCIVAHPLLSSHLASTVPASGRAASGPESQGSDPPASVLPRLLRPATRTLPFNSASTRSKIVPM
eukprot:1649964-Rhodomonas_salina.1